MKDRARGVAITLALGGAFVLAGRRGTPAYEGPGRAARDYPVQPVPFTAVHFDDAFWLPIRRVVANPAVWRVYKDGEEWKPVATPGPYGVEEDRYNKVAFEPVTTSGLRLEVVLPREWSAGIQEWKVQ